MLLFVLITLFFGATLALLAKGKDAPSANAALNINSADAAGFARTLSVANDVGERLYRERMTRGAFEDVDGLGRIPISLIRPRIAAAKLRAAGYAAPADATALQVSTLLSLSVSETARFVAVRSTYPHASWERVLGTPLLPSAQLSAAVPTLAARTWPEAERSFLLCCGLLAAFLIAAHFLLRRARPPADPFLLPISGLLSVLGVLLLFSIKDPVRDIPSYVAQTEGIVIGGGLAMLVALSRWMERLPLHRYGYVYAVAAIVGTVILGAAGSGPGGVRLSVAGAQPVELIKILLVFFLAAYLAERGPILKDPLRRWGPLPLPRRGDLAPLLVLYALPLALFAIVRDLGPVLLLFGAFLLLVYVATGRVIYVALGLIALLVGAFIGYKLHFGVFRTRVDMWLMPWANHHKSGDHLALGLWGMASGGPIGSGMGLGAPHFIPRGGSVLAFAALGEEAGLFGTFAIALCFLTLLARGLRIARRAGTDFERLLAAGLALLIAYQALIIMCGCLGLLPLAGITLPLVSYGKSSLIATFFAVGTLLSISSRTPQTVLAPAAPPEFRIAATRLGLLYAAIILFVIGGRLLWVQAVTADAIAGRSVHVPDADGMLRPHVNPRLLQLAQRIGRGKILDRNGIILATTQGNGRRAYPLGPATAHLIGYLDPAVGGPTGMEARFDSELRGFDSWSSLTSLWRYKDMPGFRLPQGSDITLALDSSLQKIALRALQDAAGKVRDKRSGKVKNRGAIVVLDVATGGILASVSSPTFDPNGLTPVTLRALTSGDTGKEFPLINRVSGGWYPPGSTFKIVTATALLQHNGSDFMWDCHHIDENVYWHANGETYARRHIADDETDRPHGRIGLAEAIVQSCNIYYAHAALLLGPDAMRETASHFGFGRLPGLEDFGSSLPETGYGQGPILASPLEMADVALTIAAGGKRLRARYRLDQPVEIAGTPLTADQAAIISSAMRGVTLTGTAAGLFGDLPFPVAGKTGTAQNDSYDRMAHSWFIGFEPADHPRIAFAVLIENGGYGAATAATASHAISRAIVGRK